MNEQEFLNQLRIRARDQERIIKGMYFPKFFSIVSFWLGDHPWRILIPLAIVITLIFHAIFGQNYDEFILKIFGKL